MSRFAMMWPNCFDIMDGILNLLKPSGMTSQQAVAAVRRILSIKKVGHGGTLDPEAAGVLPVFIGKATRLAEYALEGDKEYIGQICFGRATETQDAQGAVTERNDKIISEDEFCHFLALACGTYEQVPSVYSAIKIDGERAYRLARAGKEVAMKSRIVDVYETEYLAATGENNYLLRIRCSKGTYVRTICNDWGKMLGSCAHLAFLLRTRTGDFKIEQAITFEELQATERPESLLLPLQSATEKLPRLNLAPNLLSAIKNGQSVPLCSDADRDRLLCCAVYAGDDFCGIGTAKEDGRLHMIKVFI